MPFGNAKVQRPGRKLLIAAMAATFGMGLSGCNDDNNSSNSGPDTDTVRDPKGSIMGSVVDENGAPLAGVTVSIGNRSLVTDVNGGIQFDNVPVANTNSDNGGGNAGGGVRPNIVVTLRPPAGFAGATATVEASAQLSCTDDEEGVVNPQCVFIDGFTASVGTVSLPRLNSRVIGTLRDSTSELPVSGATVEIDFRTFLPDQPVGNGVTIALNHPGIAAATTAADGSFVFTGVAADSCFEISRTNFTLASQGDTGTDIGCGGGESEPEEVSNGVLVNTNREGANTASAGSLIATPAINTDTRAPYVTNVSGVLNRAATIGMLSSGIDGTGGITVTFNEAIVSPLSASDIQVVRGTAPSQQVVPFTVTASTATSVTIALATGLPAGEKFSILIKRDEAVDPSDNALSVDDDVNTNLNPNYVELGFDAEVDPNLVLNLQIFQPFQGSAGAVTLTQVKAQQHASLTAPFLTSSSFLDSLEDETNTSEDTSPDDIGTTDEGRLGQLSNASPLGGGQIAPLLELGQVVANVTRLNQETARVTIDLTGATPAPNSVAVSLFRNGNIVTDAKFYTIDTTATVIGEVNDGSGTLKALDSGANDDGVDWYAIKPNGDLAFDLIVTGAEPGDVLRAVSRNVDLQIGGEAQLTLDDATPPTTALSPLADGLQAINSNLSAIISAGGAIGTGDARHLVVFPVSPQSLDIADGQNGFDDDSLQQEIESANTVFAADNDAGADTGVTSDATATAAFTGANVRLAVAFTEELGPLTGAPATPGFAAVLSNFQVRNDQAAEDGNRFSFVAFDTSNVFALESDGRGDNSSRVINFTDVVKDLQGNTADAAANARVLVRDVMPPLMTRAYRNAAGFTFEFHEAVRLQGSITLDECGDTIDLSLDQSGITNAANRITLSNDNKTVTVPLANPQFPASGSGCFLSGPTTTYAEAAYDGLGSVPAGSPLAHGRVSYSTVPDRAAGTVLGRSFGNNTWATWSTVNLGMSAPQFAAADLVGPFIVTGISCDASFADDADPQTFSCDIGFSHPLQGESALGAGDGNALDVITNPAAYFQLEDGGADEVVGVTVGPATTRVGTAASSGTCVAVSGTCNVVRVSFTTTIDTVAGDRVNQVDDTNLFVSQFDNNLEVGRNATPPMRSGFRNNIGSQGVAP